jgi:clan AA aspartic protease (TIGR02281 family)
MKQIELELRPNNSLYEVVIPIWSNAENRYYNVDLIVDTGASVLTLHADTLERLGYKPEGNLQVTTASQTESAWKYTISSIKLSDTELENVEAIGQELPYEIGASGLLGLNVLSEYAAEFRFKGRKLILRDGGLT